MVVPLGRQFRRERFPAPAMPFSRYDRCTTASGDTAPGRSRHGKRDSKSRHR